MPIQKLIIDELGPFNHIKLRFDRQVNVFIGPNNCGKSTILMSLATASVFPFHVPERLYRSNKKPRLTASLWDNTMRIVQEPPWAVRSDDIALMKQLGYTGFVPALRENTGFRPRSPMGEGTVEPHRIRVTSGREVHPGDLIARPEHVVWEERMSPDELADINKAYMVKLSKDERTELTRRSLWISSPSRITDQAIVSKIVELDYRAYRKNAPRFRKIVEVVASIASEIMIGFPLTFTGIEENKRGLYPEFSSPDGPLPLDKLSQGTQSIIQWVSHLVLGMAEYYDFPDDLNNRSAVFIIDEIDAHMHPEWQRRIIPAIIRNLPNCQLFVSTHSPLILSGLTKGQVQLLTRNKHNRVEVSTNEEDTRGWSFDEIMRWLMGMSDTFDSETEKISTELTRLRDKKNLTKAELEQLETLRAEIHNRLVRKREAPTKLRQAKRQA